MSLFREVMVWCRLDDRTAMRYTCFHDLLADRYIVQSADFFYLPLEEKYVRQHAEQLVEWFVEFTSTRRGGWSATLAEAIAAHDYAYSDEGFDDNEADAEGDPSIH